MLVMDGIKEFEFNEHGLQKLKELPKGTNWPVVYLIHDEKNLYIGETTSAAARMPKCWMYRLHTVQTVTALWSMTS